MNNKKVMITTDKGDMHYIENKPEVICAYIVRSDPRQSMFVTDLSDPYEAVLLSASNNRITEIADKKLEKELTKLLDDMMNHRIAIPPVKIYEYWNNLEDYQLNNSKRLNLNFNENYKWNTAFLDWALEQVGERLSKEIGKELSGYQIVDCAKIGFLEEASLFSCQEEAVSFTYFYNQEATDYLNQSDLSHGVVFKRPIDFANKLYNYAVEHLFHDTDILLMEKKKLGQHEINSVLRHTNSEYGVKFLKDFRTDSYMWVPNKDETDISIELKADSIKENRDLQQQILDM